MHRTELSKKLLTGPKRARRQPMRLLVMLCIVAVFAASCGSEATSATAEEATADGQSSVTTTAEPEAEPDIVQDEAIPAPDADVIAFTEAWGVADSDTAWSYVSARCNGGGSFPVGYVEAVDGYAAAYPGATAVNVVVVFGDSDTAAISYDVHDGSGEFAESYNSQPWAFVDGKWYRDHC